MPRSPRGGFLPLCLRALASVSAFNQTLEFADFPLQTGAEISNMRKGREKQMEKEEVLQKKVKKQRENIWPASLQPYSIVV